ncbi:DUF4139 domain-containing protein [Streptomyces sp. NPDC049813]|uniref:DUF4139 domain-containing protein n=1 Tax=Streptomyces sp. NPDC049813 TaxID=3365597 RepID=UPI0037993870
MTDAARSWDSKLTSVVVYASGAVCRRRARGTVAADGRVHVTGLPRTLDPGSLRAAVVDAPGARVTGARLVIEAEPPVPGAPQDLLREAERLSGARRVAAARHERQSRRIEETAAVRPVPPQRRRDDPHRRAPVQAWFDLADFVDTRLAELQSELDALEEELQRLDHELALVDDRLERASTAAPTAPVRTSAAAALTVEGAGGEPLGVEIEYRVPGAVWVPSYRLTYRQDECGGQLVLRASVAQRTGEDWSGVRLGLSTADLRRPAGVPALRSVRIGRRQPVPAPSGWREPPAGLDTLFAGFDAAVPRPYEPHPGAGGAVGGSAPDFVLAAPAAAAPVRARAAGGPRSPGAAGASPGGAPPAPQAYGAPPPAPQAQGAPPPAPQAYGAPPPTAGGVAPPAPGSAAPPPPPPPGPPRPDATELDYAGLVLSGPDAGDGRRGLLAPGAADDAVAAEYRRRAEAVGALPLPGYAVRPRDAAGSFDHRYDARGDADIPSDGTWHTVTVTELPVQLRTEYLCVPSVEPVVYATLVLGNATDQALLAGPVDITCAGEHLPTTRVPTLAPGGTGRVALGPAEAIRVSRRTELRESSAGLRGTTTVLDHRVHVELTNRLSRPATVEVRERVPVTSDGDIRIEEQGGWERPPEGGDDAGHPVPGTRRRRVDVPPGATVTLDGGFEIRIPAAKALTGGNRRS